MQRIMLRAKIHRASVTQCDLNYEGSCGIDEDLLEAADIREFEKIELYNINNGERFSTYAIRGKRGTGEISLNGAAARLAQLGDLLIICTYSPMNEEEVSSYKPKVVFVDEKNRITGLKK
ncbi:MAG: aspartate 1-decarboxylase precursor protein [Pseudomonadota bacterium]|jgi:aspartate 1-decarboxylase|nr:aspartate 1-decarboxylase [Oxalobacteraceae bacterium]